MNNKSLAQNAFFKSILNVCNIIIPIIVGPYVLRILDRSYYDTFNGLNATFQLLISLGAFGIYNYGIREISRNREDITKCSQFITEMFIFSIITNLFFFLIALKYIFAYKSNSIEAMICWILCLQFFTNVLSVEWINEANESYLFITVKSVLIKILYLIAIFLLVRKSSDILWYTLLLVLSGLLNMMISFIHIKKKYKFSFTNINLKKHIKPLLIVFIISNIMLMYAQLDKIMLNAVAGSSSVSSYQIAQYISFMVYSVFISIIVVAIPRFSNMLASGKEKECFELHQELSNSFYFFMIPASIGIIMLSKEIVFLYGGEQYMDCAFPLAIYAILQLSSAAHFILGDALLYTSGNEIKLFCINMAGGILHLVLNILLVVLNIFSTVTAITSLITTYIIISLVDYHYVLKKLKYKYKLLNKQTIKYLFVSLLFIPTIIFTNKIVKNLFIKVIVDIIVCALEYFLILFAMKDEQVTKYFNIVKYKLEKTNRSQL